MYPLRAAQVPALVAALVAFTAFSPAAALAAPSPKDKADARAFVTEARKAVKDKHWSDAIAAFLTADGLDPSPAIELELAQTQVAAGKLAEAAGVLTTLCAGSDGATSAKKAREAAKKALDELKPRIPTVKVTVTGPTTKVGVIVDGADVDASGEILVNPGAHTVGASADGWNPAEKDVTLAEGAHALVELTLTTATTAPPPQDTSGSRLPGVIVASGGGAVLLVGAIFGGLAFSATSAARAQCVGNVCQPSAAGDISRSKTFGNVSTGMFIAGGAVAATGVVLAILAPWGGAASGGKKTKKKDARLTRLTPWLGPDQVGLAGAF